MLTKYIFTDMDIQYSPTNVVTKQINMSHHKKMIHK